MTLERADDWQRQSCEMMSFRCALLVLVSCLLREVADTRAMPLPLRLQRHSTQAAAPQAAADAAAPPYQLHDALGEKGTLKSHVNLAHLLTTRPGGKPRLQKPLLEAMAQAQGKRMHGQGQAEADQQWQQQQKAQQAQRFFTPSSSMGVLHCAFQVRHHSRRDEHGPAHGRTQGLTCRCAACAPLQHLSMSHNASARQRRLGMSAHDAMPSMLRTVDSTHAAHGQHAGAPSDNPGDNGSGSADVLASTLHVFVRAVVANNTGNVHAFAFLESANDQGHKVGLCLMLSKSCTSRRSSLLS